MLKKNQITFFLKKINDAPVRYGCILNHSGVLSIGYKTFKHFRLQENTHLEEALLEEFYAHEKNVITN